VRRFTSSYLQWLPDADDVEGAEKVMYRKVISSSLNTTQSEISGFCF
jgi:hypothetical protein